MLEDSGDESFLGADIAILPPSSTGNETDADSGDEFVASGDPNNLNRNQLVAEACVRVRRPDGYVRLGLEDDSECSEDTEENLPSEPLPTEPLPAEPLTEKKSKRKLKAPTVSFNNTNSNSDDNAAENPSDGPPAAKRSKRISTLRPSASTMNTYSSQVEPLPAEPPTEKKSKRKPTVSLYNTDSNSDDNAAENPSDGPPAAKRS